MVNKNYKEKNRISVIIMIIGISSKEKSTSW